jgi:hypothetical protein
LARVTRATKIFILKICKNDIILVKILQKKKKQNSMGFKMGFKNNLTKKLCPYYFDHGF